MLSPDEPLAGDLPDLIRYSFESQFYYDVESRQTAGGFTWALIRRPASPAIRKEYPWRPFEPHVDSPRGYVALIDDEPVGYVESAYEDHWRLVRIWHFYVRQGYRRQGVGRALMQEVEQAARHFRARGIILETQTCNDPAILFYQGMGLEFWGLNTAAYSNSDIDLHEVLVWMGKTV